MRNIVFVIPYPIFGGPHNQALQLAPEFERAGFKVVVVLPTETGNAAPRLLAAGIEVVQLKLHRPRASLSPSVQLRTVHGAAREVRNLVRTLRRLEAYVVFTFGVLYFPPLIAAKFAKVPAVVQLVDSRTPPVLRATLGRAALGLADAVMATGLQIARLHPPAARRPNLVTFVPPVDGDVFCPSPATREAARRQLAVTDDEFLVGTVGNINPQKGHGLFVQAAARLRARCPRTKFLIIGSTYSNHARYAEQLWRAAAEAGLAVGKDLLVIEAPGSVASLLPAMDIFWITSEPRSEGIPTAMLEAMACSIPIVSVRVGAIPEIVRPSHSGLLVSHSPAELSSVTADLLDQSATRAEIGNNGRTFSTRVASLHVSCAAHIDAIRLATAR